MDSPEVKAKLPSFNTTLVDDRKIGVISQLGDF